MKIQEVVQRVETSKRAIKYYEEQGLLKICRDENGYRNYSEEDLTILKQIVTYRKLGISISDIKILLKKQDSHLLAKVLLHKEQDLAKNQQQVEALRTYLKTQDIDNFYHSIHYQTIALAMQEAIPGFCGYYFLRHFLPYLQIEITTPEQKQAYHNIIHYWDETQIQLPLCYRISGWFLYRWMPRQSIDEIVKMIDTKINKLLFTDENTYEELKEQMLFNYRRKNRFYYKYSIFGISQRKLMKELQDKGYNDIFIPNMIALSPTYRAYPDALKTINNKICQELGFYYDSNFQLVKYK